MKRVIFDIVLFTSVFVFPWWISAVLLVVGIFAFNNFYEFIVASVITYSLYAVLGNGLATSPVFYSSVIIFIYVIIQAIRRNIILYKK